MVRQKIWDRRGNKLGKVKNRIQKSRSAKGRTTRHGAEQSAKGRGAAGMRESREVAAARNSSL